MNTARHAILTDTTLTADQQTIALAYLDAVPEMYIGDIHGLLGWEDADDLGRLEIINEHLVSYIKDAVASRLDLDDVDAEWAEYRDDAFDFDALTAGPYAVYADHTAGIIEYITGASCAPNCSRCGGQGCQTTRIPPR